MRNTILPVVCYGALFTLVLTGYTHSQVLRLDIITDQSTSIRGTGIAPALHSNVVAMYGFEVQTVETGIFMSRVDGAGGYTAIAKQGDPVPNNPGRAFESFGNPSTHAGVVAFAGGWGSDPDGIYLGSGGELEVAVDQALLRFPFLGPDGLTHALDGGYETMFYTPHPGGATFALAVNGEPAPGGGTFATFSLGGHMGASLGGGVASFPAYVNHPGGVDVGVYVNEVATDQLSLIANWDTTMPGRADNFDFFDYSDTDGENMVFIGFHGNIYFGGHTGVYIAPVESNGNGPFTVVVELGDIAPGASVPFQQFGEVAIQGDLIVFEGFLDSQTEPTMGLYGWRDGELFKIYDNTDSLFGEDMLGYSMSNRGLDGNQLVFRGTYYDPEAPFDQGLGVYVATLQGGISLFGPQVLIPGTQATLETIGAMPGERVYFLYSLAGIGDGPCIGPLGGMCLDLLNPVRLAGSVTADSEGRAVFSAIVPSRAPSGIPVYTQAVVRRGAGGMSSIKSNTSVSSISE
jgi:hypothetical protein